MRYVERGMRALFWYNKAAEFGGKQRANKGVGSRSEIMTIAEHISWPPCQ
jgi:hypothetical protein